MLLISSMHADKLPPLIQKKTAGLLYEIDETGIAPHVHTCTVFNAFLLFKSDEWLLIYDNGSKQVIIKSSVLTIPRQSPDVVKNVELTL